MYFWEEVVKKEKKWRVDGIESIKTEGLEFTWSIKEKGSTDNDSFNHQKGGKEERGIGGGADWRDWEEKIPDVIVDSFILS